MSSIFGDFNRTNILKKSREAIENIKSFDPFSSEISGFIKRSFNKVQPSYPNVKFKSGRLAFDVFEKRMQPKIENLKTDGPDAIGLESVISSNIFNLSVLDSGQEQIFLALRQTVKEELQAVRSAFAKYNYLKTIIDENLRDVKGANEIINLFGEWDRKKSQEISARDQIIGVRSKINHLRSLTRQLRFAIPDGSQFVEFEEVLSVRIVKIDTLVQRDKVVLEQLVEDVFDIENTTTPGDIRVDLQRTEGIESALQNPYFKFVRSDFLRGQLPSIPVLAMSFAKMNERDPSVERDSIIGSASPNATMATAQVGSADDIVFEEEVKAFGPLNAKEFDNFAKKVKSFLGASANTINDSGFLGSYQFGSGELIRLGYVKPGTTNRSLKIDKFWLRKDDISNRDNFLGSDQEKIFLKECRYLHSRLVSAKIIERSDTKAKIRSYVAIATIQSISAAKKHIKGEVFTSGNGKTNTEIFDFFREGEEIETKNREEAEQNQLLSSQNSMPDSIPFSIPSSTAAPIYPHNQVKYTESGHYQEMDDTPGSERISEKHRTGTGYEIDADGNKVEVIKGDRYSLTVGSDFILVNGSVNIYVEGDAGVVANNVNINAKEDMNITCGSSLNIKASDLNIDIEGHKVENVGADSAVSVGGFMSMAVEGNLQFDSKAFSAVARGGGMDLESLGNLNIQTAANLGVSATGNSVIQSAGNTAVGSLGSTSMVSSGPMSLSGDSLVAHGASNAVYGSGGSTTIAGGGTIKLSHPVEKALYSNTAGSAPDGAASPVDPSGSSNAGGRGDQLSDTETNTIDIKNKVETFTSSDFDSSQSATKGV